MGGIAGIPHQRAINALAKAGFRIARQGKHVVMTDGQRIITIPRHDPLNAYTLAGIVRSAGVAGDLLQSREMRSASAGNAAAPGSGRVLALIVSHQYLLLAMLSMAISFFAFRALVQTDPMSFAVPASAGALYWRRYSQSSYWENGSRCAAARSVLVACGILLVAR